MARFDVEFRIPTTENPTWEDLVKLARLGKSVEIVVIDHGDGESVIEVRRWKSYRDDGSNRPEAKMSNSYSFPK